MPQPLHLLPTWCPFGVSTNVPLLYTALKTADDGSEQVLLVKVFSLH